jgi:sec-independent protein translocase protein TatA
MHAPGVWGIVIVAVVVLVLFGRGKISGMMGELASGIKEFRVGMRDAGSSQGDVGSNHQGPKQDV